jgi:hypothetical protein
MRYAVQVKAVQSRSSSSLCVQAAIQEIAESPVFEFKRKLVASFLRLVDAKLSMLAKVADQHCAGCSS